MSFVFRGQGLALPAGAISQEQAAAYAGVINGQTDEQRRLIKALYRRSGVALRHSVVLETDGGPPQQSFFAIPADGDDRGPSTAARMQRYEQQATPLAARAARGALAESASAPHSITHLITVSCSGFSAPGVDVRLIDELGLSSTVQRTNIGFMGCHGALNGLRVARAFAQSDTSARVLLCATELCSLHYRYGWDPEQVVANALFADGAAAVVGSAERDEDDGAWRLAATGSCLIPDSADAMTWRIGDHGFVMTLSSQVPHLIRDHLRAWVVAWLDANGLRLSEVRTWAVHPGGPRILNAVEAALTLDPEALAVSHQVLRDYGNMSSPTILFILERLRQQDAPRPCVALGFGPGMMAEALLFR